MSWFSHLGLARRPSRSIIVYIDMTNSRQIKLATVIDNGELVNQINWSIKLIKALTSPFPLNFAKCHVWLYTRNMNYLKWINCENEIDANLLEPSRCEKDSLRNWVIAPSSFVALWLYRSLNLTFWFERAEANNDFSWQLLLSGFLMFELCKMTHLI